MPNSTVGQEWIFLGCLLAGLIMGVIYEAGFILRFCFTALFKESGNAPAAADKDGAAASSRAQNNGDTAKGGQGKKKKRPKGRKPSGARYYDSKFFKRFQAESIPSFVFTLIIDLLFFAACFILILLSARLTADGQIFWFSVAAYILGFTLERISLGIIVAKFINMIYNAFARLMKGLKKIKFFGKLFR